MSLKKEMCIYAPQFSLFLEMTEVYTVQNQK